MQTVSVLACREATCRLLLFLQEAEHRRQHDGADGEVRVEPGRARRGANSPALRGEKTHRGTAPSDAAKVLHVTSLLQN